MNSRSPKAAELLCPLVTEASGLDTARCHEPGRMSPTARSEDQARPDEHVSAALLQANKSPSRSFPKQEDPNSSLCVLFNTCKKPRLPKRLLSS